MIKFEKIHSDIKKMLPGLANICREDESIAAAYLFGSYARSDTGPMSDVDIAVLLDRVVKQGAYFDKRLDFISKFCLHLKTNEVEMVILNEAPMLLAYQVVKEGILLYERDHNQRIAFETRIIGRYLDSKYYRKIGITYLKKRIERGNFLGQS